MFSGVAGLWVAFFTIKKGLSTSFDSSPYLPIFIRVIWPIILLRFWLQASFRSMLQVSFLVMVDISWILVDHTNVGVPQ
jgi:hypothetical protein